MLDIWENRKNSSRQADLGSQGVQTHFPMFYTPKLGNRRLAHLRGHLHHVERIGGPKQSERGAYIDIQTETWQMRAHGGRIEHKMHNWTLNTSTKTIARPTAIQTGI